MAADQSGRHDEAIGLIGQAIAIKPGEAVFHYNLGIALTAAGQPEHARESYQSAVTLKPEYADAHTNLGLVLKTLGRLDDSIASTRRALALAPDSAPAHNNLGIALREQGNLDGAVASYRAALARRAAYPEALTNLGLALKDQGHLAAGIACCRRATALRPDMAELHYNLATALLTAGHLPEGWEQFEWRRKMPALRDPHTHLHPWRGEAVAGCGLLVHAEQGFGDTLQFCRYATLAAGRGLRVTLEVPAPLVRLLRTLRGVDEVVATGEPPAGEIEFCCPVLSLPLAFRTDLASIPHAASYLHADPAEVARWRSRLDGLGKGTRVGLVWAGNPRRDMPAAAAVDRRRSMSPHRLAPLFNLPGVQFFSLQKDHTPPADLPLVDLMEGMADFADTAALIATLDLVISVDSAVAHLAAALGKPVWLLDRFDACWRWLRGRRDSPWYPSLRIYRQPGPGDWDSVVAEICRDLRNRFDRPE